MTALRYPALQGRRDENEPAIIAALEAIGASVDQNPIGRGQADLTVGYRGSNYLLEVKMPKGTLNKKQAKWHQEWKGQKAIVHNAAEALDAIGAGEVDLDKRARKAGL